MDEMPRHAERPLISRRRAFVELVQEHKTTLIIIFLVLLALPGGLLFFLGFLKFLSEDIDDRTDSSFAKPAGWLAAATICGAGNVVWTSLAWGADPANNDTIVAVSAVIGGCLVAGACFAAIVCLVALWMVLTSLAIVAVSPVNLWVAVTRRSGRSPHEAMQAIAGLPSKMIGLLTLLGNKIG